MKANKRSDILNQSYDSGGQMYNSNQLNFEELGGGLDYGDENFGGGDGNNQMVQ